MSENNCYNLEEQYGENEIVLTNVEYNQILNLQQQILEMLSSNNNTTDILSQLCLLAESLLPDSIT